MRIIDLDMDFFLNKIAYNRNDYGELLGKREFIPWTKSEVVEFLEEKYKLDKIDKIPGRIVEHHYGAYYFGES